MGFKPDLDGLIVPENAEMTYNVLSGTLSNQPTNSQQIFVNDNLCKLFQISYMKVSVPIEKHFIPLFCGVFHVKPYIKLFCDTK